jgi:hypothetical protein
MELPPFDVQDKIAKDELHRRSGGDSRSSDFQGHFKGNSSRCQSLWGAVEASLPSSNGHRTWHEGNKIMNAQRPIPHYIHGLSDLARLRAMVTVCRSHDSRPDGHLKWPIGVAIGAGAILGLALCALIAATLGSAPTHRADLATSLQNRLVGPDIERNVAALRRSRAWWEGYGQRHPRTDALAAR